MRYQEPFFLIFLFFALISCSHQIEIPKGLRKLNFEEILQIMSRGEKMPNDVKVLLQNGDPFDNEAIAALNQGKLITDVYVDSSGVTKLVVLRKTNSSDKERLIAMEKQANSFEFLDVDCKDLKNILDTVYKNDQASRGSGAENVPNLDKENQRIVLSMIQKCGFPSPPLVDKEGLETIFYVIQHGSRSMRAKYYNNFLKLCNDGQFNKSLLILMEDRILVESGKKQKYGTQFLKTGQQWELYPVDHIDSVTKRRQEMGMEPVEQSLKRMQ